IWYHFFPNWNILLIYTPYQLLGKCFLKYPDLRRQSSTAILLHRFYPSSIGSSLNSLDFSEILSLIYLTANFLLTESRNPRLEPYRKGIPNVRHQLFFPIPPSGCNR